MPLFRTELDSRLERCAQLIGEMRAESRREVAVAMMTSLKDKSRATLGRLLLRPVFPDFLIIGAQKSGTSALHYYLGRHPKLHASVPKELHYFDRGRDERPTLDRYKANFLKPLFSRQLFFEATPSYLYHSHIPAELIQLMPDIRFIAVLRNPVDRAYSAWNMYREFFAESRGKNLLAEGRQSSVYDHLFAGRAVFPNFEEAIDIERKLMAENGAREPALLRRGLYYDQLMGYLEHFDPSQLLVVESAELQRNTLATLDTICGFLGISPFGERSLNLKPRHVRRYAEEMKPSTRRQLEDFYRIPNEQLFRLLNRRFGW